jgi:hypothetical protein
MGKRKSITLSVIFSAVALSLITGCAQTVSIMPGTQTFAQDGTVSTDAPSPGYTQFPDLPFPGNAKMNIDRTFIVGSGESWFGQTIIEVSSSANTSFDFYIQNLSAYGWKELSSVRAITSVLTYTRANRVLTIQINKTRAGNSEILVTVSPRNDDKMSN